MPSVDDILSIDHSIRTSLSADDSTIRMYEARIEVLRRDVERSTNANNRRILQDELCCLETALSDVKEGKALAFYLADTFEIVEAYKALIQRPLQVSFFGTPKDGAVMKEKQELLKRYLETASKYIDVESKPSDTEEKKSSEVICAHCHNDRYFEVVENNTFVCLKCCALVVFVRNVSASCDIDRINITSKYLYERKAYFYDTIIQYQGKQNVVIEQEVYDKLERALVYHGIASADTSLPRAERFKDVTKDHIWTLLREIDTKHYDNINLIHFNITEKKPDDIGHLEDRLLSDFDKILEQYDKLKNINRKNFISSQYILYQLLRRHHHPCNKEDFVLLKRIERKILYDDIYSKISNELQWAFEPII